ncbi:MAG: aminotransferase class I/II-fold pyridoxal phosphate-dependent enzyme, partial [Planctomycetota bacterium]
MGLDHTDPTMTHLGYATRAVHLGTRPDPETGAVVEPVHLSSVFAQPKPGVFKYDYGRSMNPGFYNLETCLAGLEHAKHAVVTSSGVGAMTCLIRLLEQGQKLVMPIDLYGGTYRLFAEIFHRHGIEIEQVDLSDLARTKEALGTKGGILYIETPTNPVMHVYDLEALSKIARDAGCISVVDNTFASPVCQKPLEFGIDIVLHSMSKYIGGHSDIVGGCLMTNDKAMREELDFARKTMGVHLDPMSIFLVRRSIKTLPLRVARQSESAMKIARFFEQHPKVKKVAYPGLESHPDHALAKKQMTGGFACMMSVYFDLSYEKAMELISSFDLFTLAESLGAVESLVE